LPHKNQEIVVPILERIGKDDLAHFEGQINRIGKNDYKLPESIVRGKITGFGRIYIENLIKQKRFESLVEKQAISILDTNASVIKTNLSTNRNYKDQQKTTRLSLQIAVMAVIVAFLSFLGTIYQVYISIALPTQEIEQLEQKLTQEIDSLMQIQKNSSKNLPIKTDNLEKKNASLTDSVTPTPVTKRAK